MAVNIYEPDPPPFDAGNAVFYAWQEFLKIAGALQNLQVPSITLDILHVAPTKVVEGLVVCADGTDWNPGSGAGLYMWKSGAWLKL